MKRYNAHELVESLDAEGGTLDVFVVDDVRDEVVPWLPEVRGLLPYDEGADLIAKIDALLKEISGEGG